MYPSFGDESNEENSEVAENYSFEDDSRENSSDFGNSMEKVMDPLELARAWMSSLSHVNEAKSVGLNVHIIESYFS